MSCVLSKVAKLRCCKDVDVRNVGSAFRSVVKRQQSQVGDREVGRQGSMFCSNCKPVSAHGQEESGQSDTDPPPNLRSAMVNLTSDFLLIKWTFLLVQTSPLSVRLHILNMKIQQCIGLWSFCVLLLHCPHNILCKKSDPIIFRLSLPYHIPAGLHRQQTETLKILLVTFLSSLSLLLLGLSFSIYLLKKNKHRIPLRQEPAPDRSQEDNKQMLRMQELEVYYLSTIIYKNSIIQTWLVCLCNK